MTPSQQKFLFVLVRDALRSESDQIEAKRYASKHIPALRLLGYLNGDELTKLAYQELFSTFELLSCPTKVQYMAGSFGIEILWRKPKGVIKDKLDRAGDGRCYRNLMTAFVNHGAKLETWYHEFGHILYGCIKNYPHVLESFNMLEQRAYATYPVVSHDEMPPVHHAVTNQEMLPSPGRYLLINKRYLGLSHSGHQKGVDPDELWASLFGEYQSGGNLQSDVCEAIEIIIAAMKALPTPLELSDRD